MSPIAKSFWFFLQNALDLFIPYHILMQMLAFVLMHAFLEPPAIIPDSPLKSTGANSPEPGPGSHTPAPLGLF